MSRRSCRLWPSDTKDKLDFLKHNGAQPLCAAVQAQMVRAGSACSSYINGQQSLICQVFWTRIYANALTRPEDVLDKVVCEELIMLHAAGLPKLRMISSSPSHKQRRLQW